MMKMVAANVKNISHEIGWSPANETSCVDFEQNTGTRSFAVVTVEGGMAIEDFKGTSPEFMPEEFFSGRLEGWAVFESLVGGLQKRATISAQGSGRPEPDCDFYRDLLLRRWPY